MFIFLGCSTPYQSVGFRGGYFETKIDNDTFFVGFRGNGYTGAFTAKLYTMRRAAELTLKNGYTHFVEISNDDSSNKYYVHHFNGNYGSSHTVSKPETLLRIKLIKDNFDKYTTVTDAKKFLEINFPDSLRK